MPFEWRGKNATSTFHNGFVAPDPRWVNEREHFSKLQQLILNILPLTWRRRPSGAAGTINLRFVALKQSAGAHARLLAVLQRRVQKRALC